MHFELLIDILNIQYLASYSLYNNREGRGGDVDKCTEERKTSEEHDCVYS